jgi:hypothetical protein
LSCPSTYVIVTREQSTAASSGSLTATVNGIVSPYEKSWPLPGVEIVTVGAVLPTPTCTPAVPVAPAGSRTVRVTL